VGDQTSDVWEAQYDTATDTTAYVPVGSVNNVDVQSLRVRHLANRIVLKATYVNLNKKQIVLGATGSLRFNDGPEVGFFLDTYYKWSGETVLFKTGSGDPISCSGFDHTIDYAADTVEVSIPRKCVGDPRWVRAAYLATGNKEDDTADGGYRNYRDNALSTGHGYAGYSARVRKD
jgi:hypothetical protein